MPSVFNQKHPSELAFDQFVESSIAATEVTQPHSKDFRILRDLEKHKQTIEEAFSKLSKLTEKEKIATSGIEWFLDNYYVIKEAFELIEEDLPEGFFRKLPAVDGPGHPPRVYYLTNNAIAHFRFEPTINDLSLFLNHYQKEIPLEIRELWALPLMLRLNLVELIASTILKLVKNEKPVVIERDSPIIELEPGELIARATKTLILLNQTDWNKFFESHSQVNKVFTADPAKIFGAMDFETRDHYRKVIEKLAEHTDYSEVEVANKTVSLAENADKADRKARHVGYYLIGEGKTALTNALGYRPGFIESVKGFLFRHNTAFYLSFIFLVTLLVFLGIIFLSRPFIEYTWQIILIGMLSVLPATSVGVNLVNSILTALMEPHILPKMDYRRRIPTEFRTLVAIPALLTEFEEIHFLLKQIELHYLANKDRNIGFILLTDYADAPQENMPEDEELLEAAISGINALNHHYQGDDGRQPFYLFHRRRQWNPKEDTWMGWERKRGKLADFNRYLIEGFDACLDTIVGDLSFLERVRFVITVDADTVMSRGSAKALIATLAHPLNQATFHEDSTNVASGYTILQPRTEVKPTSVNKTVFTRIFAGDLGLDLYTRAVSDIYQDLFHEGIYVGKGIYDVHAFQRSLENKVPDNALLSHDLFEGLQGRAALVSDVVFFEDYPPDYASQVTRLHRWVRGDWQLLPWLFPFVPGNDGQRQPNPFSAIDKWKIIDNLRRSLLSPAILTALIAGWFLFKDHAWVWTVMILLVSAFPLLNNILMAFSARFMMGAKTSIFSNIRASLLRWLLWIIFLPYESLIMLDAITSTLVRVFISHKRLLQWQTSAHTVRFFGKQHKIAAIWQRMISAPIFSIVLGSVIALSKPASFWTSFPLLTLWAVSPQFAYGISLPKDEKVVTLTKSEDKKLKSIARRTWLYFERFVGPEDHWLPPDHFQEDPKGAVAHRTSPTNIGLMLLSSIAAYDFGYIGMLDFVYRMTYAFETMDSLEKYRGHLLNWYDTESLDALSPRYVSTVDSGNLAVSFIGLLQFLIDLPGYPIFPAASFQGIVDSLDVFCEVIQSIDHQELQPVVEMLSQECRTLQNDINALKITDGNIINFLSDFNQRLSKPTNTLIQKFLETKLNIDPLLLQDIRYWSDATYKQVTNIQQKIEFLAPWLKIWQNRPDFVDNIIANSPWQNVFEIWVDDQSLQNSLEDLPVMAQITRTNLELLLAEKSREISSPFNQTQQEELIAWIKMFSEALRISEEHALQIIAQIEQLKEKTNFYLERMEFDFLFDRRREVFYLGYQIGSGRLDRNHYDLFASEARTASLFAIAQDDVPPSHWLKMSRPLTTVDGIPTLISWNGSMFEYLMPNLYTHTYPETLLEQTEHGVVKAQIAYARENKVPWGISESSYYRFDNANNYQYKGFGVPQLGRKRGLASELVIAPYASLLAVGIDPKAVLANVHALEDEGAMGHFGFYESIDYTASRLPNGQKKAVIKTYMAHHQGMIMVALANYLNARTIVDRVHKDPRIQSAELLLQEQIPEINSIEKKAIDISAKQSVDAQGINIAPWFVDANQPTHHAHLISNGNLQMLMTESGSGYLAVKDYALTRWRKDATLDTWGIWFYMEDLEHDRAWSIGKQPMQSDSEEYRVIFSPHMTEIRQMFADIRVILQTTIAPDDDICIQRITLSNQSSEIRHIRLLSYGEVVLAPQAADRQHPAFNKMFIESSFHESESMLFFRRRKRSSEEEPRGMAHALVDDILATVEYEGDRGKFLGRGEDITSPIVITEHKALSGTVGTTLDPIFSLGKRFTLKANQTVTLTYFTLAGEDESWAKEILFQYSDRARINNAFSAAKSRSESLLRTLDMENFPLARVQELFTRIIYPSSFLRAQPGVIARNSLGQSGLWSFGISGDHPMLLIKIDDPESLENLHELLTAHRYWRKLGTLIDLVILNTKDAGYTHGLNEKIHQVINVIDSQHWVNQRGGIFVLTASQIENDKMLLIQTAANVVIDFKAGDLEAHLNQAAAFDPSLPPFVPSGEGKAFKTKKEVKRPDNLLLDNEIGGFSPDGKEYIIYLQDYPKRPKQSGQIPSAPWINVIANKAFGFTISESGSGFSWAINSGENRLSPWMNDPVSDASGECLYLRDEITGKVWSPTPLPSGQGSNYLVRHGQGYTIFESYQNGFKQIFKTYVDPHQPVKINELTIKNETDAIRRLTATYYIEWVLGTNREETKAFLVPSYEGETGSLIVRNPYSAEFSHRVAFLTSDQPVHGLTTDRAEFLGLPGNRQLPKGLQRIGLKGEVKTGVDPCAALQIHINLEPGEEKTVSFVLGQGSDLEETRFLARRFSQLASLKESWAAVNKAWDLVFEPLQVETPHPEMDLMLNRWLPYQALSCRIWGRSALYQSSGAYGFRDQLQDVTAMLISKPDLAREHILRSARHQFEDGDVLHWWHPPSGRGVRTRITDDLLWLVYVTAEYVLKTGDTSILQEKISYKTGAMLAEDEEERYGNYSDTATSFTLFDHCQRALRHGDTQGPHGLPLIGGGDWNDGMNRVGINGRGESVWLAWFLYENHQRFAVLAELIGDDRLVKEHRARAEEIRDVINAVAWDGNWYLRAYYDDGTPLGSHLSAECQIDSLPQSWAVLTQKTLNKRQIEGMKSVESHLVKKEDRLIRLFTPPFDDTEKDPGYIKGYPPGIRENGGQYTHAAIWAVWALTELGEGDKAFEQFSLINPVTHSLDLDSANLYAVEPYVVAADVYSTPPFTGRGGWTWYTGSSGWLYRLGTEAILGFKLRGDEFVVDPCIPAAWDSFKMTFRRDDCSYEIQVNNPDHVEKGVRQVELDGKILERHAIPILDDQAVHHVTITMGN